jgi:hypothetical protein
MRCTEVADGALSGIVEKRQSSAHELSVWIPQPDRSQFVIRLKPTKTYAE